MPTPTNVDILIHVSVLTHSKCDLYKKNKNVYIDISTLQHGSTVLKITRYMH